jgi:hypothetical protein
MPAPGARRSARSSRGCWPRCATAICRRWRSYDAPEWEPAERIEAPLMPEPEPAAEEAPEAPKGNRFSGLDFA